MTYNKQSWNNGKAGGTPLSADRLNHIEDGVEAAAIAADAAQPAAALDADTAALVPTSSGSDMSKALSDAYARRRLALASRLRVWGHSYAAGVGVGVTAGVDDFATLVAGDTGLPIDQHAVGGTVLYNYLSPAANWTDVLENIHRPAVAGTALDGLYLSMYGINDLAKLGNTEALMTPFTHAMRASISRYRAGGFFADSDVTVTLGGAGSWIGTNDTPYPGGHVSYNTTDGATVTITTDADFPGGYVVPLFMTWTDAGGAIFTGSGAAAGYSIDTHDVARTDSRDVCCLRIPAKPGAATYTLTTSGTTGGVGGMFLGWHWEPVESGGPLVVLVKQPKPVDYTDYDTTPPTDAGVDALNAITDDLAGEFGARCVTVDCSVMDHSTDYFIAGNVHPNVAGHAKIAELIEAVIGKTATVVNTPADVPPALGWTAYTPTLGGTGTTQGAATMVGAYRRDGDTIHFHAQATLAADTVIGSHVEMSLPVPLNDPAAYSVLTAAATDAGIGNYQLTARVGPSTKVLALWMVGTNGSLTRVTATVPFAWGTGDVLEIHGTYVTS